MSLIRSSRERSRENFTRTKSKHNLLIKIDLKIDSQAEPVLFSIENLQNYFSHHTHCVVTENFPINIVCPNYEISISLFQIIHSLS